MKRSGFILIAAGGLALCLTAMAANEATYTPEGRLVIPHLNLLNVLGDPVASYELTMQKESGQWRFILEDVVDLPFSIPDAGDGSILTDRGRLFIPHAKLLDGSGQTIRNYAVHMRRDSQWRFKIYGLTDLDAPASSSTDGSDTNTTSETTKDVSGDWEFSFTKSYNLTNSGTAFGNTTEMTPYSPEAITLTLDQTDEDVTGTGTGDSVHFTLSGQISGDLFSFSLLTGSTNESMSLTSGHVAVGDGTMSGDYYANTEDLNAIEFGTLSAIKQ